MDNYMNEINDTLERIGSKYRTSDGLTVITYIGQLTFLKRTFETSAECLKYVQRAEAAHNKAIA